MKNLIWVLAFSSTLTISSVHASLNMKPGLWSLDTKITSNGKQIDATDRMKEAMAKMPEAQRKKIMEMVGQKSKIGFGQNGEAQVCYPKNVLENPEYLEAKKDYKCHTKILTKTSKKLMSEFKCDNGSSGDSTWNFESPEKMNGIVNIKSSSGKSSQINYNGKFVKKDCGDIAPII